MIKMIAIIVGIVFLTAIVFVVMMILTVAKIADEQQTMMSQNETSDQKGNPADSSEAS